MRLAAVAFIGLTAIAAPALAEPGPAEGAALYDAKCKMCHEPGMMNAPKLDKLATFDNEKIIQALTTPVPMMAGVVGGLSEEDKRNIAVFLTKKSMAAGNGLPEVVAE